MSIQGPKGPGGPPSSPPIDSAKKNTSSGANFKEALNEAQSSPEGMQQAQGLADVIAKTVEQVKSGALSAADAKAAIVSEVANMMGPLPEDMKARLETFVAAQLQNDPGLSAIADRIFNENT